MNKTICFFLLLLLLTTACQDKKKNEPMKYVGFTDFNKMKIQVSEEFTIEGFILGASFEKKEIFVKSSLNKTRDHLVKIIDAATGKEKKKLRLHSGSIQSPQEFQSPSYMAYSGKQYFIIDQYSKIVVYDDSFNYLFTSMFQHMRWGIDFYKRNGATCFFLGRSIFGLKARKSSAEIFRLPQNNRPERLRILGENLLYYNGYKDREDRSRLHIGVIWAVERGFEKDGNIFFSSNCEPKLYIENLQSQHQKIYQIPFLKPRIFTNDEASKFKQSHQKKSAYEYFTKQGIKVEFESYPEPLYHFGIYDVGENKIGIIGAVDLKAHTFRLDIIHSDTMEYMESITLPFGYGFSENMAVGARGLHQTFINIDCGIYAWGDLKYDEDPEYRVNITHIKLERFHEQKQTKQNVL